MNWNILVLRQGLRSKVNYYNIFPTTPFPSNLSFVDEMFIFLMIKAMHVYFRNKVLIIISLIFWCIFFYIYIYVFYKYDKLRSYYKYICSLLFFPLNAIVSILPIKYSSKA